VSQSLISPGLFQFSCISWVRKFLCKVIYKTLHSHNFLLQYCLHIRYLSSLAHSSDS